MSNLNTREQLIEATKKLLLQGTVPGTLTARQISSEAGTNLAMINYCFASKDELLKIAVDEIVADEFSQYVQSDTENLTAKQQLRKLLNHICIVMVKYRELTKLSIPYLLLNSEITLPLDILPFIKSHFKNRKNETQCRIIAFQMVYSLQLIFYRAEDFYKYCTINVLDEVQLEKFIDMILDLYLGEE